MKKITVLLFAVMLVLPSAVIFAQDSSNDTDSTSVNQEMPKPPDMPVPPSPPALPAGSGVPMPSPIYGITGMPKTVVATSDGGIVIVQGNKITKFDKDLEITKSIELKDTENTAR